MASTHLFSVPLLVTATLISLVRRDLSWFPNAKFQVFPLWLISFSGNCLKTCVFNFKRIFQKEPSERWSERTILLFFFFGLWSLLGFFSSWAIWRPAPQCPWSSDLYLWGAPLLVWQKRKLRYPEEREVCRLTQLFGDRAGQEWVFPSKFKGEHPSQSPHTLPLKLSGSPGLFAWAC